MNYLNSDKLLNTVSNPVWRRFTMTLIGMCVGVGMSFGQTFPAPQTLPYIQNFDATTISAYPIGIQGYRSSTLTNFDYLSATTAAGIANRVMSSEFDLNVITTAGTAITTSTIHLITSSGPNKSLAISIFNRAAGFVSSINATGKTDVKVSFDIIQLEQESITTIFGFSFLEYSVSGMSAFATVPGSFYTSESKISGQTTKFLNLSLPNSAVSNIESVRLRWLTFSNVVVTNFISFSYDNISITASNLSPVIRATIPYLQNFNSAFIPTPTTSGVEFARGGSNIFGYANASAAAFLSRDAQAVRDSLALIAGDLTANTFEVVTGTGGNQLIIESVFNRPLSMKFGLDTRIKANLLLSYDVVQFETSADVNDIVYIVAEYRIGSTGSFTSIAGTNYNSVGKVRGAVTSFNNLVLPTIVSGKADVEIRLLTYVNAAIVNYCSPAIDNFKVDEIILAPTTLQLTSITPASPTEGFGFTAQVNVLDQLGNAINAGSNLVVNITTNGVGSLSGSSVTILGASSSAIANLNYTTFGDILLGAVRISGPALATSSPIAITVNSFSGATFLEVASSTPATGSNIVAGRIFSVVVNTKGPNGLGSVLSTTSISLGVSVGTLSGVTTGVFSPGTTSITISGVLASTQTTNASLFATVTDGDVLTIGTLTGVVIKPIPSVLSLSVITGTGLSKNTPFSIIVSATNVLGESIPLSSDLIIALSKTSGSGTLNISSTTITSGAFAVTVTGVKYSGVESGVSFGVSAAGFTSASSTGFTFTGPPLPAQGFTNPTPKGLPYTLDWGTDPNAWVDGNSDPASNFLLPIGMVGLRGIGSGGSPLPSRTQDDATLAVYSANNFIGGGASLTPVTIAGEGVGLELFRSNTRANGLLLAVKTGGFENIKVGYSLTMTTSAAGANYGLAFEYRIGNTGFFNTLSVFESTAPSVALNTKIPYEITLPASIENQSNVQFRWVYWNNSASSGVVLDNISISGTKTDYLTISTPVKGFVGDAVSVSVTAFDKFGALKTVSGATVVTITGNLSLSGITVATIAGGNSSVLVSGLVFGSAKKSASLQANVVSGDAFGAAASNLFNVSGIPVAFKVLKVQPLGNIQIGKAISVEVELVDANGNNAFSKTNLAIAAGVVGGTGAITGTTTGTFMALTDSIITIKFFSYDKAESGIKFSIDGGSLTQGLSDTLSVRADALAGITILYSEDFEKTVKPTTGNAALPTGMKMFNIDGQTAITATYPTYGTDAWVVRRVPQEAFLGRGPDLGTTQTFWSNINSVLPDSNYIAYATSWFNDNTKAADRWLVTPGILMQGSNFNLKFQAKSSTSSGNFKDRLEVKATTEFAGNGILVNDWSEVPTKNLETGLDSNSHLVSTRVINFEYKFVDSLVKDQIIYLAFRLVTPADRGDRVSIDNIFVTAGGLTTIESTKVSKLGLYPNPATESISLSFMTKSTSPATVSIVSATGTVAAVVSLGELAAGNHTKQIDVSAIPSGFYMVKVQTGTGVFVTKFLKQ